MSEGWVDTPLRHLATSWCDGPFGSGLASEHYTESGARVVRLQNIRASAFDDSDSAFIDLSYFDEALSRHAVLPGDLLIAGLGDDNNFVGRACVAPNDLGPALVKADCFRFRLDAKKAEARFVAYALSASAPKAAGELSGGSTRSRINLGLMAGRKVLLPPIHEQERIANFLDEQTARIDALIAEKEALKNSLREHQYSYASHLMTRGLSSGIRLKATGHPEVGDIPQHWNVKRLKFLGEVRSGIAKGKDHGGRDVVSLPYLRVANVQDGYVDLGEVLEIEVGTHEVERFLLQAGDVLMNEGGDNDKLGRGTVWRGQIQPCVHQNHVFAVRLQDVSVADWVARFTSTDAARTYFFLRSKQSTNLASINQANVRELPVPMPSEEERRQIMAELERSLQANSELAKHVTNHIERLREYRSSLISAAVTGQLDLGTLKEAA